MSQFLQFLGVLGVALISTLGIYQGKKLERQNTDQHNAAAAERKAAHDEILAHLTAQDATRGEQVDGLHSSIGHVEGKLDAHIADKRAHRAA